MFLQNFFLEKDRFLGDFSFLRGVIFANRKKKIIKKMSPQTNPTWKVRQPVKQGFFFCGLIRILVYIQI